MLNLDRTYHILKSRYHTEHFHTVCVCVCVCAEILTMIPLEMISEFCGELPPPLREPSCTQLSCCVHTRK